MLGMWRRCSSCRDPIDFLAPYWKCSVSTCQRSRTALYFCQVSCWDAHLATANHREAWAVEERAPSEQAWKAEQAAADGSSDRPAPRKVSVNAGASPRKVVSSPKPQSGSAPKDILIVVSKLKKYIKASSGMRTSDACAAALSEHVRELCDRAVRNAAADERQTVLDRDFYGVL